MAYNVDNLPEPEERPRYRDASGEYPQEEDVDKPTMEEINGFADAEAVGGNFERLAAARVRERAEMLDRQYQELVEWNMTLSNEEYGYLLKRHAAEREGK